MQTTLRKLPEITIGQRGIHEDALALAESGYTRHTWYVVIGGPAEALCYRAEPRGHSDAIATVDVLLPSLMFGSADEVREDVRLKVEDHALACLGPL